MGTNMHQIAQIHTFNKRRISAKPLLVLFSIFLLVLFGQVEYMLFLSKSASQINDIAQKSNQLKMQNQQLTDDIARLQDLDRVASIAQNQYHMQPVNKVVYLNSGNTLSYNGL